MTSKYENQMIFSPKTNLKATYHLISNTHLSAKPVDCGRRESMLLKFNSSCSAIKSLIQQEMVTISPSKVAIAKRRWKKEGVQKKKRSSLPLRKVLNLAIGLSILGFVCTSATCSSNISFETLLKLAINNRLSFIFSIVGPTRHSGPCTFK